MKMDFQHLIAHNNVLFIFKLIIHFIV